MAIIRTTKRGAPYYVVRWDYQRDENGKQTYKQRGFRSEAEAKRHARHVTTHRASTAPTTIAQLCDQWLIEHAATLEKHTQHFYQSHVKLRIKPGLGSKQADKLTPLDVHRWQRRMLVEHSAHSANGALRTLRACLKWCSRMGLTDTPAAHNMRSVPAPDPEPAKAYTPAEIERIAKGCELLQDAVMIRTAAFTGLRPAEVFGLWWEDIELDAGIINVRRAVDRDQTIKPPKTRAAKRQVEVLRPALDALTQWRTVAPPGKLVFPDEYGRPLGSTWRHRNLKRIREASGIPFKLNQLRDTYATILIESGASEAQIRRAMGHTTIITTHKHYAAHFAKRDSAVAAKANSLLAGL